MRVTDEMVEKAAHVLAHAPAAWTVEQEARAVLEAMLPGLLAHHLCDTCPGGLKCERKDDIEYACADGPFPARAIVVECALREKWIEYVRLLQREDEERARDTD